MKARRGTYAVRTGTPLALCATLALAAGCGDGGGDGGDDPATPAPDVVRDEPTGVATTPGGTEAPVTNVPVTNAPAVPGSNAGVGGDPDGLEIVAPAGTPADAASPWLVFARLFAVESDIDFGDARVQLIGFDDPRPFADHVEFYIDYVGELDRCIARDLIADGGPGGNGCNGGEDDDPLQVSGGQTLLISSAAGTFGEIPLVEDPGNVYYDTDGALPGPLPAGATLSIPGDVFPAVDAYPIPGVRAPERLSPVEGEALTSTSEYRWVAGTGNTFIKLDFLADDAATGDFLGFPVSCLLIDDGGFELPDESIEALVNAPGDISARYSRVNARIELRDDIAFFTFNELVE